MDISIGISGGVFIGLNLSRSGHGSICCGTGTALLGYMLLTRLTILFFSFVTRNPGRFQDKERAVWARYVRVLVNGRNGPGRFGKRGFDSFFDKPFLVILSFVYALRIPKEPYTEQQF
jgi:hypothetical protein